VITKMSSRVAEIRKADPSIRSDQQAMLRLSESRSLADQVLWRDYKDNTAPVWAIGKTVDSEKAIRKMATRCDELMARDPSIRSRAGAIAKIAQSTNPGDQKIWQRYKAAGQVADVAQFARRCASRQVGGKPRVSELVRRAVGELPAFERRAGPGMGEEHRGRGAADRDAQQHAFGPRQRGVTKSRAGEGPGSSAPLALSQTHRRVDVGADCTSGAGRLPHEGRNRSRRSRARAPPQEPRLARS
jgi:hypothetical protein